MYICTYTNIHQKKPDLSSDSESTLVYALFTIMLLRDSIIYINVQLSVCKDAGQHPDLQGVKKMESFTIHKMNMTIHKMIMLYDTTTAKVFIDMVNT